MPKTNAMNNLGFDLANPLFPRLELKPQINCMPSSFFLTTILVIATTIRGRVWFQFIRLKLQSHHTVSLSL